MTITIRGIVDMKTHWFYAIAGAIVASAMPYVVQYGLAQPSVAAGQGQRAAATITQPPVAASIQVFDDVCVARRAREILQASSAPNQTIAFLRQRYDSNAAGQIFVPTAVVCGPFSEAHNDHASCKPIDDSAFFLQVAQGAIALARIQTAGNAPASSKTSLRSDTSCVRTLHSFEDIAVHARAIHHGIDDMVMNQVAAQRPQAPLPPLTPRELERPATPR